MKKTIILTFAILSVMMAFGQSRTVADFEKESEGYKLFLYQSVIRMLNKDHNPEFNMLIRNLDHLRFVSSDASGDDAKSAFKYLDKGVRGEGFEEIMSFDNTDYRCRVYEMESSKEQSTWVVTLFMDGTAGVLEMEGSLDLKYLSALSSLNMDRMKEMMPE